MSEHRLASMQKTAENENLAWPNVFTNPTTASSGPRPVLNTNMDQERVKEAAKRRAQLEKANMKKRARALAVHEYVTGPALAVAANPPATPQDRKKAMRNKSAFISRQTQRYYQQFLAEYITKAEMERDAARRQKESAKAQVDALRGFEQLLQSSLSANAAPSAHGRPRSSGSSSHLDAMRGGSYR